MPILKIESKYPPCTKIKLTYMKGQVGLKRAICTPHKPINKKELNLIVTHTKKVRSSQDRIW